MQRAADPLDVRLVVARNAQSRLSGQRPRHAREVQHLGHHQEHDEAAVGVDRRQAAGCFLQIGWVHGWIRTAAGPSAVRPFGVISV